MKNTVGHSPGARSREDLLSPRVERREILMSPKPEGDLAQTVFDYLIYGLSIPERALRSATGLAAGTAKEAATFLVPMAFRNSRAYKSFFGNMLDFLIDDFAGASRTGKNNASDSGEIEEYVARKTVSSFLEMAGMATLHVSPLTVMAITSDVAHGSNHYLKELAQELEKEGILENSKSIQSSTDLLDAVAKSTGKTADYLSAPPLSIKGIQDTLSQIKQAATIEPQTLPTPTEIGTRWEAMREQAATHQVSLFELSSTLTLAMLKSLSVASAGALSSIRVTGNLFDRNIFDHYRRGVEEVKEQGVFAVLKHSSGPYIDAVWFNFSSDRRTFTDDLISGKLSGKAWDGIRSWIANPKTSDTQ